MRGKQRTRGENYECWYTQFTGIFQDVYLEKVGNNYFEKVLFSGDIQDFLTAKMICFRQRVKSIVVYYVSLLGNYAYTNIVERFELVKFNIVDIMPFAQFCKNICVDKLELLVNLIRFVVFFL